MLPTRNALWQRTSAEGKIGGASLKKNYVENPLGEIVEVFAAVNVADATSTGLMSNDDS
jgi:hypothetical protein